MFHRRLAWAALSGGFLCTLSVSALTDAISPLFSGSGNCAFCHEQWGGALLDAAGNNVSITGDWRATMMAHSFVDPLWRARMEAEVADRPELREFIEDKCLTCHAPMARTQYRHDEGQPLGMDQALGMDLAHDGVSCSLCHQIKAESLGEESSLDGGYKIGTERRIYGPYTNVVTMPMKRHVDYTPGFGAHVQQSGMCATCHTLFTPVFDGSGAEVGLFPEQVPYLEWKNSIYPAQNRHCQDCHMPRLDEPIQITARPPWIGTREPFWKHTFLGANVFMMQLLADPENELYTLADAESFELAIERTRRFLREETARLSVSPDFQHGQLLLRVRVVNLAGHKFPTGYPYRRAWLRVVVNDEAGLLVFSSGTSDGQGWLDYSPASGYPQHEVEIVSPRQVQVYQAVMGDANGNPTTHLLRATHYLKDNRIPPKGFRMDGPYIDKVEVRGVAATDPDYREGDGCDVTLYRIPLPEGVRRVDVDVQLLYQSVPAESVAELLESDLPAAQAFSRLYKKAGKQPQTVQSVRFSAELPR